MTDLPPQMEAAIRQCVDDWLDGLVVKIGDMRRHRVALEEKVNEK